MANELALVLETPVEELIPNQGSAMHLITSADIGKLRTKGYDGIVWDYGGSKEISVFDSSQIKLITNENPTQNSDIRYALPDDENNSRGGLTRGQRAKFVANNTQIRVYSKAEAADIINAIIDERLVFGDKYGSLSGKSRAEVIETLFRKLNSTKEGYRIGVALNIADYIIENAVLTDMFDTRDTSYSMEILSGMRKYMHGVNLNGIKSEIQYRFDKKNSINLVWGAKTGGISPDVMVQELSENYGMQFEAINEADQFFEMLEKYEAAKNEVNERVEKVKLTAYGINTVQYRVCSLKGALRSDENKTAATVVVQDNYPPFISGDNTALGNTATRIKYDYVVYDGDDVNVTVKEYINTNLIRTYTATGSNKNTLEIDLETWNGLTEGDNYIRIVVTDDNGASATQTKHFNKIGGIIEFTYVPFGNQIAVRPKAINVMLDLVMPLNAKLQVLASNNANDTQPVWDNITTAVLSKHNHVFSNKSKEQGVQYYGVAIKVKIERNGADGDIKLYGIRCQIDNNVE